MPVVTASRTAGTSLAAARRAPQSICAKCWLSRCASHYGSYFCKAITEILCSPVIASLHQPPTIECCCIAGTGGRL